MKKWRLLVYFILCIPCYNALAYTVVITESELQTKISALMPIEKTKLFVTVKLFNPLVDLSEQTNKMGLFSHILVYAPGGLNGQGTLKITGSLSYDADKGAFYFHEPQIESFESKDIPEKYLSKVKLLAQLAAEQYLSDYPIYRFKDNNIKHTLAKAVLQSVLVKNRTLVVELGVF